MATTDTRTHWEIIADEKLAAAARMWERLGHQMAIQMKHNWMRFADNPVGWTDAGGNVLIERGPGYYRARSADGEEEATIWAPVPFL